VVEREREREREIEREKERKRRERERRDRDSERREDREEWEVEKRKERSERSESRKGSRRARKILESRQIAHWYYFLLLWWQEQGLPLLFFLSFPCVFLSGSNSILGGWGKQQIWSCVVTFPSKHLQSTESFLLSISSSSFFLVLSSPFSYLPSFSCDCVFI